MMSALLTFPRLERLFSGIGREELNAAVLSYLSASGYRLTAMTLKDEAVGKISRHQPRDGHAALVSYFRVLPQPKRITPVLAPRPLQLFFLALRGNGGECMPACTSSDAAVPVQAFREIDALRQQLGAAELRAREMEDALDAARKWELELRASYDRVDMESQCLRGDIAVLNEQLTAMQVAVPPGTLVHSPPFPLARSVLFLNPFLTCQCGGFANLSRLMRLTRLRRPSWKAGTAVWSRWMTCRQAARPARQTCLTFPTFGAGGPSMPWRP